MPSKIGIHGIRPNRIGAFIERVVAAGAHVATAKSVDDLGWLAHVKQVSPDTVTVGRVNRVVDIPLAGDLREEAREALQKVLPQWEANRASVDYWEVINEMDPPSLDGHRRLAEAMIHFMELAEAEGFRLALFSYSMGVPEWEEMEAIVETGVFARAKQGGHIFALHEYGNPIDVWFGDPIPPRPPHPERGPLACRYRWWYDEFLIPRDEVIPLVISEAGTALGIKELGLTPRQWVDQIAWYDERLREDPYVIGCHLFTLGPVGYWHVFDYEETLDLLAERIIALRDEPDSVRQVSGEEPGHPGEEPTLKPRTPYRRHYFLLPPDATWEWVEACRGYWEKFRVTIGGSADDAGWGPGLETRTVTAVSPQRWPSDLKEFLETHYPGCIYDPIRAETPQKLKTILDRRVQENKRLG
ncbi:MAG TPA: hypothetical protein ENI39_08185 [Anaerolineae bacterium]|nr:hypothetical protein [Anaerolineae bacterium]